MNGVESRDRASWKQLVTAAQMVELKLVTVWGVAREVVEDPGELPGEWSTQLDQMQRFDDRLDVRVRLLLRGPGGELMVDVLVSYEFLGVDYASASSVNQKRFVNQIAVLAAIPMARVAYEDLRMRLGMFDAPRLGLIKFAADGTFKAEGIGPTPTSGDDNLASL
jgi:hypothetical protein